MLRDDDDEKTSRRQWHLDKNISIGHIITTMMVAVSLIAWGLHMETRLVLVEAEVTHSHEANARIEQQVRDSISRIEALLTRIDEKIDRKEDKK